MTYWTAPDSKLRKIAYGRGAGKVWHLTEAWFATAARLTSDRWWVRWPLMPLLMLHLMRWLPELLYMATAALRHRWRPASSPPAPGVIVAVHTDGAGGFGSAFWCKDKGWSSAGKRQPIRVYSWRWIDGSRAEPWHEDCSL